jgi:very-short-patch-repair endonuclease
MLDLDPHALYSRHDLLGWASRRDLARALSLGAVVRLRRGVYASADMPEVAQRAATVGGRLTCLSALQMLGLFTPERCGLHVQIDPGASRIRGLDGKPRNPSLRAGLVLHWTHVEHPGTDIAVDVEDAVRQLLRCQSREACIAVLDNALHQRVLAASTARKLIRRAPQRLRLRESDLDPSSESGIESLTRTGLRDAGLQVDSQVAVPGVGRVDLLVGGAVVVEVDGRRWHQDRQARDYWRDLQLARRGYAVVRVDYALVMNDLELVVNAVRRAAARAGVAAVR